MQSILCPRERFFLPPPWNQYLVISWKKKNATTFEQNLAFFDGHFQDPMELFRGTQEAAMLGQLDRQSSSLVVFPILLLIPLNFKAINLSTKLAKKLVDS